MSCSCRKKLEEKLLDKFKEQQPTATEPKVSLKGYSIALDEGMNMREVGYMPMEFSAAFPLKKGGAKTKTIKSSMVFTYCPFCGEKYKAGAV